MGCQRLVDSYMPRHLLDYMIFCGNLLVFVRKSMVYCGNLWKFVGFVWDYMVYCGNLWKFAGFVWG